MSEFVESDGDSQRPRIRWLTALLVVVAVALAVVAALQQRTLAPLQADARRLHAQVGFLSADVSIDDPAKAYAIALPTVDEDLWRWQVYLPPGRMYSLAIYSGSLPVPPPLPGEDWFADVRTFGSGGTPTSFQNEPPGRFVLETQLEQHGRQWWLVPKSRTEHGRGYYPSMDIRQPHGEWLSDGHSRVVLGPVNAEQVRTFDASKPILLVFVRRSGDGEATTVAGTDGEETELADAFAIWLEPTPLPATMPSPASVPSPANAPAGTP